MAPGVGVAISPCFSVSVETGNGPTPPGPAWALWLMQEGSGQVVADSSGNGRDMVLGTSTDVEAIDPAWTTIGGVTCLEFNGAHIARCTSDHNREQPFTIVTIVRRTNSGLTVSVRPPQQRGIYGGSGQLRHNYGVIAADGTFPTNTWISEHSVADGESSVINFYGRTPSAANAGTLPIIRPEIGAYWNGSAPTNPLIGQIAAVAIIAGALDQTTRDAWSLYLAAVKGVTL